MRRDRHELSEDAGRGCSRHMMNTKNKTRIEINVNVKFMRGEQPRLAALAVRDRRQQLELRR
jgi:hypothetical protein